METNGKKIAVLGGGISGLGAAILGRKLGYDVFVSEGKNLSAETKSLLTKIGARYESGGHTLAELHGTDFIVKSPGIPNVSPLIRDLRDDGKEIIGELEFAYRALPPDTKIIAVTGSNGKTTTVSLIYALLKSAGFDVGLCGNVGYSFAQMVALEPHKWYVVEASSFQLEDIKDFRPYIAVILNVNNNHLDRYGYDIQKYAAAKVNLIRNQTESDYFVYNLESAPLVKALEQVEIKARVFPFSDNPLPDSCAWIEEQFIVLDMNKKTKTKTKLTLEEIHASGKRHPHSSMASCIIGSLVEIRNEQTREVLSSFNALAHRLESVGFLNGVEFINDSKATNVNAAWFALEQMTRPVVWIVGGVDKGNDYGAMLDLVKSKVKAIVTLGKEVSRIVESFKKIVPVMEHAETMDEAVEKAFRFSADNDIVLLSPACASFDLFEDYEARGDAFKAGFHSFSEQLFQRSPNETVTHA